MPMRKIGKNFAAETRLDSRILSRAIVDELVTVEIVKLSSGETLPDDEPLYLLRARDHLALATLQFYRTLCLRDGCTDYMREAVDEALATFKKFATEHPERMKQPGVTRGK